MEVNYKLENKSIKFEFYIVKDKPTKIVLSDNHKGGSTVFGINKEVLLEIIKENGEQAVLKDFKYSGFNQKDKVFSFIAEDSMVSINISYSLEDQVSGIYKKVKITNKVKNFITITKIQTVDWSVNGQLSGGGLGQPAYLDNCIFAGIEHPYSMTNCEASTLRLCHNPGEKLAPYQILSAEDTFVGVNEKGDVRKAFVEYIEALVKKTVRHLNIYGDWAMHDELGEKGYSVELTEEMTMNNINFLKELKADYGIHFDYYLMDHGWYDPAGKYLRLKKPNFKAENLNEVMRKLNEIDTKLGLWFSVNTYTVNDDGIKCGLVSPELEESAFHKGETKGCYCLSSEPYYSTLKNAMVFWAKQGIELFKLDFMYFDTTHPVHPGLPKECCIERDVNALLSILKVVKEANRKAFFVAFNGFNPSAWWCKHIDTLFVGDPQPCEIPSARLRTSINIFNDKAIHSYAEKDIPRRFLDDCGTMIGNTTTIFYTGSEDWRSMALLSAGRGPAYLWYYGDYMLLDEEDKKFLAEIHKTMKRYKEFRDNTENIGYPAGKGIYGYSHIKDGKGFITIYNPTLDTVKSKVNIDGRELSISLAPMEVQMIDYPSAAVILTSGKVLGYSKAYELKLEKSRAIGEVFQFNGRTPLSINGNGIVIYIKFSLHGEDIWESYPSKKVLPILKLDDLEIKTEMVPKRFSWKGISWLCIKADNLKLKCEGEEIVLQLKNIELSPEIEVEAECYIVE